MQYGELVDYFVTAEKIPTHRMDTPANVTVITAADIEANHYQDIYEALNHVNGVVATAGYNDAVYLNGDDRVVILIDGHRAQLAAVPSMKNIEKIEIVKGGGSALYGSSAVGGVINIITKKGSRNETTLDLNTGSWKTHNYELTNQGTAGNFSWFLTGGLQKQNHYDYKNASGKNTQPGSDYSNNSFSLRLDNRFDDSNSLTLNVLHRGVDGSNYNRWYGVYPYSALYNNFSLDYNFKEDTITPGFVRIFDRYYKIDNNGMYNGRILGLEYQNGWEIDDRNRLIAGTEYRSYKDTSVRGGYEDEKSHSIAVYVQDTMTLDDKWTLVPGIRFDNYSTFGSHWSPKLAANYRADDKTKIYASWGHTYRAPNAEQLYYNDPTMGFGDKNLRPETGHTETIGFEHDFNENMAVQLNFFNAKISHAIDWDNTIDPELGYVKNLGAEKRRGMELSFSQKVDDNWSYGVGYSHTKRESDLGVSKELYSQPNGYRVGIHYQNRGFKANLLGIMGSGLNERYVSSSYAVFDFNTGYDITEFATVYLKVTNLTNRAYSLGGVSDLRPARFFMVGAQFKI